MTNNNVNITLDELAGITGGEISGDGTTVISGVCSIENPVDGHISFAVDILAAKKISEADKPSALIVKKHVKELEIPQLIHPDPRLAFTLVMRYFHPETKREPGIHPTSVVAADAEIAGSACIGPNAVIESGARINSGVIIGALCFVGEGTKIGDNTKIYPNVTVLHDVKIGKRCIIHSGVVIGSDGFGFTPTPEGNIKVPQVGRIEIGDDVEIGANCTIDRATMDVTRISNDVKLDNLVQLAHNTKVGAHTRIAAQSGLSGRVEIGENVVVAGQAGFHTGITVGDGSVVGGRAGVTRNIAPGSRISGFPARDHRQALLILAATNKLPEILKRLDALESKTET